MPKAKQATTKREMRAGENQSKIWEWRIGDAVFDCTWVNPSTIEGKPFQILKQKRSELNAIRYKDGQPMGKERRPFLLTLADIGKPVKIVFKLDWNEYRADLMRSIETLEGCGLNTSGLIWELHRPRNYWAFRCIQ